jgi:hypothetical protein
MMDDDGDDDSLRISLNISQNTESKESLTTYLRFCCIRPKLANTVPITK